jgi:hypothetical protein
MWDIRLRPFEVNFLTGTAEKDSFDHEARYRHPHGG